MASLTFRNHALYALFPLISTDVLTPFIDLLEDALAQQVPPMVVSQIQEALDRTLTADISEIGLSSPRVPAHASYFHASYDGPRVVRIFVKETETLRDRRKQPYSKSIFRLQSPFHYST
jgi:hypothetical protein